MTTELQQQPNSHLHSTLRRAPLLAFLAATLVVLPGWKFAAPRVAWMSYEPREGDVLFQSLPRSELVNAIEGATQSPWSHCGIVVREDGRWLVCEAIGEVRMTPLNEFYSRGREGRFAVYRLNAENREHVPEIIKQCRRCLGRPYDARYRMDDEAIYCSELIFKAYRTVTGKSLGQLVKLGDLKWRPYRQVIESLEGGPVPVDREMITPRDLAQASQLELVTSSESARPAAR